MAKNLMKAVAALLGVEIGEEFIIENADRKETVVLAADGLHVVQPNGVVGVVGVVGPENGKLFSKVLQGLYEVKKKPWELKHGERYYCPDAKLKAVTKNLWLEDHLDYAMLALGMIYRTQEEAEEHLAEDYERLTGNKLEG